MRVLVTGGTGLVGRRVVEALRIRGHELRITSRCVKGRTLPEGVLSFEWDPAAGLPPSEALEGVEAVIHLAGESISPGLWNRKKVAEIRDSRVQGTINLRRALIGCHVKPKVFVGASAVGFYGDRGDGVLDEGSVQGQGFLAQVCSDWESASEDLSASGMRRVILRLGVVLDPAGGFLGRVVPVARLGATSFPGDGSGWLSWIHHADLSLLVARVIEESSWHGVLNAVSPEPVRKGEFMRHLAKALHRPKLPDAPAGLVRLLLGRHSSELLLFSQRVVPARMLGCLDFHFPRAEAALGDCLQSMGAGPAALGHCRRFRQ